MQQAARTPGDVDDASSPVSWPIAHEEELTLPDYRREITGREIGDERTNCANDDPLFFYPEPVPPCSPVASLEGQPCRRQIVDDLNYIGIADVEGQMARDCSRGDRRIAAITISKQGERSGRRNIASDP